MIDVIKKIFYGDTGSGDYVKVTVSSIENQAILMGNESLYGKSHKVVYASDIDALVEALLTLKKDYLGG